MSLRVKGNSDDGDDRYTLYMTHLQLVILLTTDMIFCTV